MKVYEAAIQVLKDSDEPLLPRDIYHEIVRRDMFKFNAKDPVAIVAKSLRTREIKHAVKENAVFHRNEDGKYQIVSYVKD